jgi:hypothetical protein
MKRRQVLAALGMASGGGALLTGTGAFTSVSANRDVNVAVVGDADAYLRLGPCTDTNGNPLPNGDYVTGASDGAMSLDLSSTNGNVNGAGVNSNALSTFDNVFQICNQGTQPVCVDFSVNVPVIPNGADVPDSYNFEDGDLAVVFYRGNDRSDKINVDDLNADRPNAFHLDVGDCQCVGFEVRAFGFETGEDLFADAQLNIIAEAGAGCVSGGSGGSPSNLVRTWADDVDDGNTSLGSTKGGASLESDRDDPENAVGNDSDFVSLGFGGQLTVEFDDELVQKPLDTDACLVETTNGRDGYPEETADVAVKGPNTAGFVTVGEATSKASGGTNRFEIPSEPIHKVRITDTTDPSIHGNSADGFEVQAVGGYISD